MGPVESFAPYLDLAIKAARAAGDLLRADLHRPTGPRGEDDKAPADTEAEQVIRGILLGGPPDWGFLGEETGRVPGAPGAPVWVVDPNDGTRDYIKGRRGSSVSIALVFEGQPVLGVVHPFAWPDGRGSVYAAVRGREGVFKDGAPVHAKAPERLSDLDIVLVSSGADRAARANLECARPARVMAIPSIAHRLAKVAAGEAAATTSLDAPKTWDFAAGHCLVLAAGGAILDETGKEPVYDPEGGGSAPRLFAGSRAVASDLSKRDWNRAFRAEREAATPIVRLARGAVIGDPNLLSRAQGALLGQLVGSALGSLFAGAEPGERRLDGPAIAAAGLKRRSPGQLGGSGELAVASSRSILDLASDSKSLNRAYLAWRGPFPFEAGHALARVVPLVLWAEAAEPVVMVAKVREDTALTHPAPEAGEAAAALALLVHSLLRGAGAQAAIDEARAFSRRTGFSREVIDALADFESIAPTPGARAKDAVAILRIALRELSTAPSFEAALESAMAADAVSDATAAAVGAVIGAHLGRDGIPERLRNLVLSCRPMEGLTPQPRPSAYWATDAMVIAESLLTAR
jgi:ADP-ribosyl-[dinitrogen reductase] hydrolase